MPPTIGWNHFPLVNYIVCGAMKWPNLSAKNNSHHPGLIAGGFSFGVCWAIAGLCTRPAIVAVSAGGPKALVFTVTMLAGMLLFNYLLPTLERKLLLKK
jgi:uncharacterized membrane protein YedE/YeeE